MKANELRIGNLVEYEATTHEIMEISTNLCRSVWYKFPVDVYICGYTEIKPILLTEEWHNRFGIKRNGFNDFIYELSDIKAIIFSGDYVFIRDFEKNINLPSFDDNLCTLWNNDERKRNMFVHEWQNLYFALTGEELKTTT